MHDIRDYDSAAHQFYKSRDIISLPLISWDFYASHLQKIGQESEDIAKLNGIAHKNCWSLVPEFHEKLIRDKYVIVVTDPTLKIVHATCNILGMTGYLPNEIIGKKPKMFQGKDTSRVTSKKIGRAVHRKEPFEAVVLNYRKDGSPYKCLIKGSPVYDRSGKVVNFIAYEKEVA